MTPSITPQVGGAKLNKTSQQVLTQKVAPANPDFKEAAKIDSKSLVEATFITDETPKETQINESILKPKASKYEPDPVPFKLPSMGKSIPARFHNLLTADKEIYIRRMSSKEEEIIAKLKTSPERFLSVITECLKGCVRTNIDIKYLMLIDKIPMFLFLLNISYQNSKDIKISIPCPECGKAHEKKVDLKDVIKIRYLPKDFKYPLSITTDKSYATKYLIEYDSPTFEHEPLIEQEEIEASQLLHNLIVNIEDISGGSVEKSEWFEIINYLDYDDKIKFKNKIEEITNNYGTDTKIDFTCENKGCMIYNKPSKADIPLDQIFINIISEKTF